MVQNDRIDIASLDVIFNRMLETITNSKDDIFIISEQSRRSFEEMQDELEVVRKEIKITIDESDNLEKLLQLSRHRLVIVSKNFSEHSEEQIRAAYENTNKLQLKVSLCREREKQLRDKRDDLERRLRTLYDTIERADHIVNQVNVIISYLTTDLKEVGMALEQAKIKQEFGIRIIAAQEEERKRLSREIHDGPAQMMANVLMRSNLIDRIYREKGADQMVFQCEKILQEEGDKFDQADKDDLNAKIDSLKEALKGEDINLIKNRQEELQAKFYEISEKLYKANAPQGDAQGFDPNNFDPSQFTGGAGADDGAADVEFTDVD